MFTPWIMTTGPIFNGLAFPSLHDSVLRELKVLVDAESKRAGLRRPNQ